MSVRDAADLLRPCMNLDEAPTIATSDAIKAMWWLSKAYLALVPADSELEITEEWLRSVGFEVEQFDDETSDAKFRADIGDESECPETYQLSVFGDGTASIALSDIFLPCKTRGDVRRLMAALGIRRVAMNDTLSKFSKPYHPNDGHGPGVPLPEHIHAMLVALDGMTQHRDVVIEAIEGFWPGAKVTDHGDYLSIQHENHRWWGIGYEPVIR